MDVKRACSMALLVAGVASCKSEPRATKEPPEDQPAEHPTAAPRATAMARRPTTVNPADPGPPVDNPANPGSVAPVNPQYPMTGFTPVADTCPNAKVLLSSSPASPPPKWVFIRATLAAHAEFKPDGSGPGSFALQTAPTPDKRSMQLVASCHDGATCNRLAATYHAVVPSSRPQVFCGDVPGVHELRRLAVDAKIPAAGDELMEKCARIGVCMRSLDPAGIGDPGLECQRSPNNFKLACASKSTCSEVVACGK